MAGFSIWTWVEIQRQAQIEKELEPPLDWDEQRYLAMNPDIAEAVRKGRFKSGWQHYSIEEKITRELPQTGSLGTWHFHGDFIAVRPGPRCRPGAVARAWKKYRSSSPSP